MARHVSRAVRQVAAAIAVAAAVVVPSVPAAAAPGPPDIPQWWFDDWDLPGVWAGGARGQGITIAVLDTGVNADLPELAGKVLTGRDFGDPTQDGRTDQDMDEFGHGTAMASLIIAEPGTADITGVAPDARILPIAIPLVGTTTHGTDAGSLAEAIRWATDQGAKIISLSFGEERQESTDVLACPGDDQNAILYAIEQGAIVVAASGNEGDAGSPVTSPGVCIGVVAVGAVDADDEVAAFSSRHPYLTVTAPGVEIPTLGRVPGDAYIGDGTSQATAIVSAGLAVIWSKHPDLTNHQVVARMLATLDRPVTTPTADPAYGFGILDVGAAVSADVPADAPNALLTAALPFLEWSASRSTVADPPPARIDVPDTLPGDVVVGARPSALTTPVLAGLGTGAVGLLTFVGLCAVGTARRRRYSRSLRLMLPTRSAPLGDLGPGA